MLLEEATKRASATTKKEKNEMIFVASKSLVEDENTHRRGKDHCTDGLRINKNGFGQRRKYGVA